MDKKSTYILMLLLAFGGFSLFISCERDDTCADREITPFLIIRFTDNEDTSSPDDVSDLQVRYIEEVEGGDNRAVNIFNTATDLDSITLSLPINRTSATYVFYQNFDEDIIDDEIVLSAETDIDTVTFNYEVREEYISRACGFKAVYSNLIVNRVTDGNLNSFIDNEVIITNTIENEDQAHVHFRH